MRSIPIILSLLIGLLVIGNSSSIQRVAAAPATTSNLNGLVMLSSSIGWAVGASGTTLRYDGSGWTLVGSGTSADLFGVSFGPPGFTDPNAGFAVGGSGGTGTAIYRSSVTWFTLATGLTPPGAQKLASVFALSATDAWAVDSVSGGIWHWSGPAGLSGGWNQISTASAGLNSVFMISPTEGWAVGVGGIIYRYLGGGWSLYTTVGTTLNSIFMLSATDGWAVGNGGTIFHFLGGIWSGSVSPGTTSQDLRSVFMISQTEGWAVGTSGATIHYTGGMWTALAPNVLATNQNLNAVYFFGDVGWAVGDSGTIVTMGSQPTQGAPSASFQSVYLSSATDGWIVGCSSGGCGLGTGEPVVSHWNGASFTRGTVVGPPYDLYSVFMVSPSEGWAAGGVGTTPLLLHYSGGTWTQVSAPPAMILRSVFMSDSNTGWAVGDGGVILRYSGGSWAQVSSPTTSTLRSVFMLGSSDGWAVGDAGTILRYQAMGGWIKFPSPTGARLNSVFLTDSSHGWAVGAGGTILHYDGNIWVSVAGLVSTNLNSVYQVNPQEAWAVGDSGTIIHWTGIGWYLVIPSPSLPGSPNLNSVFLVSTGFGLIVGGAAGAGAQGTILQVPGGTPIPEIPGTQILLAMVLLVTLALISIRRRRVVTPT